VRLRITRRQAGGGVGHNPNFGHGPSLICSHLNFCYNLMAQREYSTML
jgi:hypothetical protein